MGDTEAMVDPDAAPTQTLRRLVGVYDADATLRGEVAYWIGARLGRRHCSLCDITHRSIRQRPEWKACRAGLPVQFDTYHRNDQPADVREVAGGRAPVVVAETGAGLVLLLGPEALDACAGSIDLLVESIERATEAAGIAWPSASSGTARSTATIAGDS